MKTIRLAAAPVVLLELFEQGNLWTRDLSVLYEPVLTKNVQCDTIVCTLETVS